MRCQALIRRVVKHRKRTGEPYERIMLVRAGTAIPPYAEPTGADADALMGTERCGGRLVARVQAVEEPYFGGVSAALEVEFTCQRCQNTIHPGLPTTYTLDAWLTGLVEWLPAPEPYPCPTCGGSGQHPALAAMPCLDCTNGVGHRWPWTPSPTSIPETPA